MKASFLAHYGRVGNGTLLGHRDYRLLWLGQSIALLGDQFMLIALPWLVLQLTDDALVLGGVLAVAGASRAGFLLVGGAVADRWPARTVLVTISLLRTGLAGVLAVMLLAESVLGSVGLPMVWVVAALFGAATGIFEPTAHSAVPRMLPDRQLERGNALILVSDQLASFLGPAVAGTVIGLVTARASAQTQAAALSGVGAALALMAVLFLASAVLLQLMGPVAAPPPGARVGPVAAVAASVRFALSDRDVAAVLLVTAVANLFLLGPVLVGVPLLAKSRYEEGAVALGLLLSTYALGNLLGLALAGWRGTHLSQRLGLLLLGLLLAFAVGLTALGWIDDLAPAATVMAFLGLGSGVLGVLVLTYLQRRTPSALLGRMMSLVMLAVVGVAPLSQALSGTTARAGDQMVFWLAGAGMFLTALVVAASPRVRGLSGSRAVVAAG